MPTSTSSFKSTSQQEELLGEVDRMPMISVNCPLPNPHEDMDHLDHRRRFSSSRRERERAREREREDE